MGKFTWEFPNGWTGSLYSIPFLSISPLDSYLVNILIYAHLIVFSYRTGFEKEVNILLWICDRFSCCRNMGSLNIFVQMQSIFAHEWISTLK
jgi:hypothetical protein